MERVDCIVIGAGVVGLAVARAMAARGLETVVLERERAIGTGTSSRNSEVIHAGIYYPEGSLKARWCVRGKALLYAYCAARGIAHRRCGKWIVATSDGQQQALHALLDAGRANGVEDLTLISAATAATLEPQLQGVAVLQSGSTGIVDSHALMLSLQGDAEADGAMLAFDAPVLGGDVGPDGLVLHIGGEQPMEIAAGLVINCAGLHAQAVAQALTGMPALQVPALHLAKGSYFALAGRSPFSRLIYPVPEPGGLGVHLTLDLAGQARFGPDVEWVAPDPDRLDYRVDSRRADAFYGAIRRYWPALPDGALQPAYAGVRPKLSGQGEPAADFMIQTASAHGVRGLVNLFGIESPGLTACLAIAEAVSAAV
ncbi:NAD(P)/FAD-dependent oxidoreductase [Roseateles amylovorans]|uniref:NAD(P)/FAD-dependent oxidoreductase n=1 Tax=Roseateles amylovorans TaxID=2978473 RepID=A0ABY6B5F2_9BURK|nr:NAD(P)/FAD-dependent oxidoreductase [Roseateles amylovorans]UXH80583.1 NAD(P)/FAD-dependent oxidoreductase [Roseateles amylovorans]